MMIAEKVAGLRRMKREIYSLSVGSFRFVFLPVYVPRHDGVGCSSVHKKVIFVCEYYEKKSSRDGSGG